MKLWIALALTALATGGCGKKDGDGGGRGGGAKQPAAFAAWMPKDAAKLWEGAWFTWMRLESNSKGASMIGNPVALEIEGDKATAWTGKVEQQLGFQLQSPCEARFSEPITEGSMKGGTSYHDVLFVIDKGAVVPGSGAGGWRKGKAAIVCSEGMDGGVTILDEKGTCTKYELEFREWSKGTPATCAWSQKDGKDVLTIDKDELVATGDVLMDAQFREWVEKGYHKRAKDYADAKAQAEAKIKERDPAEKAKAAGGVVGQTDTIASLNATFASDASLKGKPLEITALYMNSNSSSGGGKTTHNVILVDDKDRTELTLPCELGETAPPEGLVQWDKVIAKGTIGESFDRPSLEGCTVAKAP